MLFSNMETSAVVPVVSHVARVREDDQTEAASVLYRRELEHVNSSETLLFSCQTALTGSPTGMNAACLPLAPSDLHHRLRMLSHDS